MKNFRKTSLLTVVICTLFAYKGWAQKGAFVTVNAGYGFRLGSQTSFDANYSSNNSSSKSEQVYMSLGKGFNFGGSIGYMFNQNLGVELGVTYLIGAETTFSEKENYSSGSYTSMYNYTTSISAKMLQFKPTLIFCTGLGKIKPYAKFGAVLGKGAIYGESAYKSSYYDPYYGGDTYKSTHKMKLNGGLAFGVNAAMGVTFPIGSRVQMFSEITMINMSYAPTKGELTEATQDGTNVLPDIPVRYKKTEFVDSYTYSYSSSPSESEPDKELKQKLPFGSIGANIGIRISL